MIKRLANRQAFFRAINDYQPGDGKHLGNGAHNHAFCLYQVTPIRCDNIYIVSGAWYNKIKWGAVMTKNEFLKLLQNSNISSEIVHFENSVADGYYVRKNYHRWEVFYRERGNDYDCIGFPSENDALNYLLNKLVQKQDSVK